MTRNQQHKVNQKVIERIKSIRSSRFSIPSYKFVVNTLNQEGFTSSTGNQWTERSLYRMLQREGISGLWGLDAWRE